MKFTIIEEDQEKFRKWYKTHREECKIDFGAIGGSLTFSFTPTGLGDIIKVKCGCGAELDLTDSENW